MSSQKTEFVIRPNSTFHPRTWIWLFLLLVVISLSIAIRFAILGYWLILPFALLDMIAVGAMFYLVTRRKSYLEKVVISPDKLEIFHIQDKADLHWSFSRHWSQVKLKPPRHRWYPFRLLLGSKGEWVEIGQCLTESEKETLAAAIKIELGKNPWEVDTAEI